jgi:hypothetical protein
VTLPGLTAASIWIAKRSADAYDDIIDVIVLIAMVDIDVGIIDSIV